MSGPPSGILSSPVLLAAGWERRYLADPERAQEAIDSYRALGFEARAEKLTPEDFGAACDACSLAVCRSHLLIYTRRKGHGAVSAAPHRSPEVNP